MLDSLDCLCGLDGLSSRFTGRRERGPRGSPGTGRGGGAHREPVVKVGGAPGARPGRGEAGRRGSGTGSWRGWGAVPVVLRGSPLRLGRHREHGRGGGGGPRGGPGAPPGGGEGPGGRGGGGGRGAGVGSWRGWGRASPWSSRGSVRSGRPPRRRRHGRVRLQRRAGDAPRPAARLAAQEA